MVAWPRQPQAAAVATPTAPRPGEVARSAGGQLSSRCLGGEEKRRQQELHALSTLCEATGADVSSQAGHGQQVASVVRLGVWPAELSGLATVWARALHALVSEEAAGERGWRDEEDDGAIRLFVVRAFVGRGVSRPRAISAELRVLNKLLGVGLPVSWAVVQLGSGSGSSGPATAPSLPWSARRGSTSASRSAPTATAGASRALEAGADALDTVSYAGVAPRRARSCPRRVTTLAMLTHGAGRAR